MLALVIAGIGIAIILGMLPRKGLSVIGAIVLWIILTPFIESLFSALPLWVTLLVMFVVAMHIVRVVLSFVFGDEAAGHILGGIVLAAFKLTVRIVFFPIKCLVQSVGMLVSRRLS